LPLAPVNPWRPPRARLPVCFGTLWLPPPSSLLCNRSVVLPLWQMGAQLELQKHQHREIPLQGRTRNSLRDHGPLMLPQYGGESR